MSSNAKLLTPEEKKLLRSFSRYAQSWGLSEATLLIYLDGSDLDDAPIPNHFDNAYRVKVPESLVNLLEVITKKVSTNFYESPDVDDLNSESIEIRIDNEDEQIEYVHSYSYYQESDTEGVTWTKEENEDTINTLTKAFKKGDLDYDKTFYELRYNGSGDSGYIEDNFESGESVPDEVQQWCYDKLESNFGGWEINEGSFGEFIFNLGDGVVNLAHTSNYEENESNTIYTESFAK